jgi:hypothetical protein
MGIERAFILRTKQFKEAKDLLEQYESTTAEHLKRFNQFTINTVAMITQKNGQVIVWAEGTPDNRNMWCVSFSVLASKFCSSLVWRKVEQKRGLQQQRNYKKKQ